MTKLVLIGSRAAKHWFPDFREPDDLDYLIDCEMQSCKEIEYHNANQGVGLRKIYDSTDGIPSAEILYTLKLSHAFWPINWPKTMHDIEFFQKKSVKYDEELLSLLYKDWIEIHGKKRAYLKKTNDDFFKDGVDRKYVHDDIHRAVAYYDEPMFEKLKKDRSQAMLSHDMFLELSYDDQLKLCREEIYVTALERFLIPKEFRMSRRAAYMGGCRLLVTSMTKGWFAKFIVTNWINLSKPDEHDFVGLFKRMEASYGHSRVEGVNQ